MRNRIFLYADCDYANINYELVVRELQVQARDSLEFIDVNQVEQHEIFKKIERASTILLDHSVIFALNFYRINDLLAYYDNIRDAEYYYRLVDKVLNSSCPVIYLQSMVDMHNLAIYEFSNFFESIDGIVWLYHFEPTSKDSLPEELRDSWMEPHDCPSANWRKITKTVSSRFQMLHCLAPNEIYSKSKSHKWDVSICGERYSPRRKAMQMVKSDSRIKVAPYRRNDLMICGLSRAMNRLRLPPRILNPRFNAMRRKHQQYILENSLTSFTCGSAYRYPVRKFFEIPAAGSLLLAHPFSGMNDSGFVDGVNYLAVNEFAEISEQIAYVKNNPSFADKITSNCREMIGRLHSLSIRVNHLLQFIDEVSKEKQVVAEFREGGFVFLESTS